MTTKNPTGDGSAPAEPLASPRGAPLTGLDWSDVETKIAAAGDYLVATTNRDGRPHVAPVLAVWQDGAVCFATFRQSRKTRNLEQRDGCTVTVPGAEVDIVIEGVGHQVRDAERLQQIADLFPAKYPWWHPVVRDGEFYDPADLGDPRHVYAVDPARVFAFGKADGFSATRWRFSSPGQDRKDLHG
ncbi:pyridoxamine 5'-phosphate oxidase family protein [Microlunatus sp. GCM10028923]|uniref:pyridoxamine 5'-phosphate oxidase family protein n=1 Tax=Microlunatus sp. GCM10028923 TaxID=3273400 RepID=UPI00361DDF8A